ncbi:MAG: hypothetical protein JEZ14_25285 [Marinilabiliaceae bacterium]|nr:hypothetical protein [Marinilabiliaceae bacterium]
MRLPLLLFVLIIVSYSLQGQVRDLNHIKMDKHSLLLNNATALLGDSIQELFFFDLSSNYKRGELNHPKEPETYNNHGLHTYGCKKLNGFIFTGELSYLKIKEIDRKYCSIYDYKSRFPYAPFDTIAGTWHKNDLSLKANMVKPLITDKLSIGLQMDYAFTTGAKQKDPRPLTRNNSISISPSAVYQPAPHVQVGLDLKYQKSRETVKQNFFKQHSSDVVFAFTGLGSLTHSGEKARYFYIQTIRPELYYLYKKRNQKLLIALYFEHQNTETEIMWRDRSTATTTINDYTTSKIGATFLRHKYSSKNTGHYLKFDGFYMVGNGRSISANGSSETSGILYENTTLLPFHSDHEILTHVHHTFYKGNNDVVMHQLKTDFSLNHSDINYSGGANNKLSNTSIYGLLCYEHTAFANRSTVFSIFAEGGMYFPLSSELIMNTTFTSSKYSQMEFDFLKEERLQYGLGVQVLNQIKEQNYKVRCSYKREFLKNNTSDKSDFIQLSFTTYL